MSYRRAGNTWRGWVLPRTVSRHKPAPGPTGETKYADKQRVGRSLLRHALHSARREASLALTAIWHKEVQGLGGTGFGILHDDKNPSSATSALLRLEAEIDHALALLEESP